MEETYEVDSRKPPYSIALSLQLWVARLNRSHPTIPNTLHQPYQPILQHPTMLGLLHRDGNAVLNAVHSFSSSSLSSFTDPSG